jgi:glycerophosphoryl diester phosphodiesterase
MKRVLMMTILAAGAAAQGGPDVLVQAHRGFSEVYPENTLLAIERAFEAGADRVEVDLALTSDGQIVLMHDRTIERTTDGEGITDFLTLAELKAFDAGSWKDPFYAGERIPTLEEALDLAEGRGELNLEIKVNGRSASSIRRLIAIAVEKIEARRAGDRVIFSSFDFEALQEVRRIDPDLRVLLIDWDEGSNFDWLDVAIAQGFYGWSPRGQYATSERLARAEAAGLFVHIGAGPGPQLLEWLKLGVDGFSADDPLALVQYLERQGLR